MPKRVTADWMTYLSKRSSRVAQELLPGEGQENAAIVPLKERSPELVFEIADSAAVAGVAAFVS
jgi:hypothetical protein